MNTKRAEFAGKLFSFNDSLKLYHWHVTGKCSYAEHIALDQAIDDLKDAMDRLVETSYALYGDINVTIPQTKTPENIIKHAEDFYKTADEAREYFPASFSQAIIDDYQEAIQQLLYRLKRLN